MSPELSIEKQIEQHLTRIEQEHDVTILFACGWESNPQPSD